MLAVENGLTETRQDSLATQTRVNALQKETRSRFLSKTKDYFIL